MVGFVAVLMVISFVLMFIGGVTLLVRAFQTSFLWGLAYLIIPFASLVFLVKYWEICKKPFGISMAGVALLVLAVLVSPDKFSTEAEASSSEEAAAESKPSAPISVEEEVARLKTPVYEPQPTPRRPVAAEPAAEVKAPKKFEQVWADTATRTYYAETCKKTPPNAYKVAKSVIAAQGFTAAPCP